MISSNNPNSNLNVEVTSEDWSTFFRKIKIKSVTEPNKIFKDAVERFLSITEQLTQSKELRKDDVDWIRARGQALKKTLFQANETRGLEKFDVILAYILEPKNYSVNLDEDLYSKLIRINETTNPKDLIQENLKQTIQSSNSETNTSLPPMLSGEKTLIETLNQTDQRNIDFLINSLLQELDRTKLTLYSPNDLSTIDAYIQNIFTFLRSINLKNSNMHLMKLKTIAEGFSEQADATLDSGIKQLNLFKAIDILENLIILSNNEDLKPILFKQHLSMLETLTELYLLELDEQDIQVINIYLSRVKNWTQANGASKYNSQLVHALNDIANRCLIKIMSNPYFAEILTESFQIPEDCEQPFNSERLMVEFASSLLTDAQSIPDQKPSTRQETCKNLMTIDYIHYYLLDYLYRLEEANSKLIDAEQLMVSRNAPQKTEQICQLILLKLYDQYQAQIEGEENLSLRIDYRRIVLDYALQITSKESALNDLRENLIFDLLLFKSEAKHIREKIQTIQEIKDIVLDLQDNVSEKLRSALQGLDDELKQLEVSQKRPRSVFEEMSTHKTPKQDKDNNNNNNSPKLS